MRISLVVPLLHRSDDGHLRREQGVSVEEELIRDKYLGKKDGYWAGELGGYLLGAMLLSRRCVVVFRSPIVLLEPLTCEIHYRFYLFASPLEILP